MPASTNLYIHQNESYSVTLTLEQSAGVPMDLTGIDLKSQMRRSYYTNSFVEFDIIYVDRPNGIIRLELDSATTAGLRPGRYVYDVFTESVGNYRDPVLKGNVIVSPSATKFI